MIAAVLVMFDVIETGGPIDGLLTIPEAFWELSLGFYLIFKGFRTSSPVFSTDAVTTLPESDSALRQGR
jgi:hypothetical protein